MYKLFYLSTCVVSVYQSVHIICMVFNKGQGVQYLRHNISNVNKWCIQEHWPYPSSLTEFFNVNTAYEYRTISCMIDEDIVHLGRPYGGLAVLWRKSLSPVIV